MIVGTKFRVLVLVAMPSENRAQVWGPRQDLRAAALAKATPVMHSRLVFGIGEVRCGSTNVD